MHCSLMCAEKQGNVLQLMQEQHALLNVAFQKLIKGAYFKSTSGAICMLSKVCPAKAPSTLFPICLCTLQSMVFTSLARAIFQVAVNQLMVLLHQMGCT